VTIVHIDIKLIFIWYNLLYMFF